MIILDLIALPFAFEAASHYLSGEFGTAIVASIITGFLIAAGLLLNEWIAVNPVRSIILLVAIFVGIAIARSIARPQEPDPAQRIVDAVLMFGHLPTTDLVFPIVFEIRSANELRDLRFAAIPRPIKFEEVTITDFAVSKREYLEVVPANEPRSLTFSLPMQFLKKDGTMRKLLEATLHAQVFFSIPGYPGRYFIEDQFQLVGTQGSARRWDLIKTTRGRLPPGFKEQ